MVASAEDGFRSRTHARRRGIGDGPRARPIGIGRDASRAWEALRPRGRLFVRAGSSSSAWEALRARWRLVVRAGGSSFAPEALPIRPTFLRRAGPFSDAPEAPRARAASGGRAREACSSRLGPRWCRPTSPHLLGQTRRTKSFAMPRRGQRRGDRATPEGPVGCLGSWPRAGRGEAPWRVKHPECRRRSLRYLGSPPRDHGLHPRRRGDPRRLRSFSRKDGDPSGN